MVLPYKYDFELSSKRRTFLWLFQVLPSIDLINYIYELSKQDELDDTLAYYGLCPRYIKTTSSWIPRHANDTFNILNMRGQMNFNTLFMKLIMEDGFICDLRMIDSDYDIEQLSMIQNGDWYLLVSNLNERPTLKRKIQCINLLLERTPLLSFTDGASIKQLFGNYINNDNSIYRRRLGIDQMNRIYIPFQVI